MEIPPRLMLVENVAERTSNTPRKGKSVAAPGRRSKYELVLRAQENSRDPPPQNRGFSWIATILLMRQELTTHSGVADLIALWN